MFKALHVCVYLGLSLAYAGAAADLLSKDVAAWAAAVLYLLLAFGDWRRH